MALNLYHRTPFGKQHKGYPPIIELAEKIGRTPDAVAMKLNNLTSLDPVEQARGINGLSGASKLDREIWAEFENDLPALAEESEPLLEHEPPAGAEHTETTSTVKTRRHQSFFRRTVLDSYGNRCAVTGIPVPELLRASHIVPWAESEQHRLNPRNGLCLSATFDAAFDRGLVAFDGQFQLLLSNRLKSYLPDDELRASFLKREKQPLRLPGKNLPDHELLAWHRERVFAGA